MLKHQHTRLRQKQQEYQFDQAFWCQGLSQIVWYNLTQARGFVRRAWWWRMKLHRDVTNFRYGIWWISRETGGWPMPSHMTSYINNSSWMPESKLANGIQLWNHCNRTQWPKKCPSGSCIKYTGYSKPNTAAWYVTLPSFFAYGLTPNANNNMTSSTSRSSSITNLLDSIPGPGNGFFEV